MILRIAFKVIKYSWYKVKNLFDHLYTFILFRLNGTDIKGKFRTYGRPFVNVNLDGKIVIGSNFIMNNGGIYNPIGRQQPNIFIVGKGANLKIGNNVGISASAIVCQKEIVIGDNVLIGGNTVIYDTDFHSLDPLLRKSSGENSDHVNKKAVTICDNVFIGAHVTILKGVTIGKNSIVAACSVVVKDIPENEIWGGNPAKYLRAKK